VEGAVEKPGAHGRPHAPALLRPVQIEQNTSAEPLGTLLARGAIDALIGSRKPDELGRHPDVARLFPDYRPLERQLYQRTRIFPIMHLIVMRRDLHERQRWIAASLYNAFVESKRRARSRMRYAGSLSAMLPWLIDDVEEIDHVFAGDAFPYGIEANRAILQALVAYMVEQPSSPGRSRSKICSFRSPVRSGRDHRFRSFLTAPGIKKGARRRPVEVHRNGDVGRTLR
jgi:4,5-dihydroxyphthalate decarboxylase